MDGYPKVFFAYIEVSGNFPQNRKIQEQKIK
jgi:hypothetical protein